MVGGAFMKRLICIFATLFSVSFSCEGERLPLPEAKKASWYGSKDWRWRLMKDKKEIHGYEGFYWATKEGEIYSKRKKLSLFEDKYGYMVVSLSRNGKIKKMKVHRLVYMTFGDSVDTMSEEGMSIDHIDRDKKNNNISNLRVADKYVQSQNRDTPNKKEIIVKNIKTKKEIFFASISDASRFGISKNPSSISNVLSGRRKSVGGWEVRYA